MNDKLLPFKILTEPRSVFGHIGTVGWGWPIALAALSSAASAFLFTALPPRFMAASFEGLTLSPESGFLFYFSAALAGGLLLSAFVCAIAVSLCGFLSSGKLALRLPAAALSTAALGISAAAMHGASGTARAVGTLIAAAAAAGSAWAAASDRGRFRDLFKAMLAVSVIPLLGSLAAGLAALAGSVGGYTAAENVFAVLALFWTAKAAAAVCGVSSARAASAVILAMLCGLALVFLLFNLGLVPMELFKALMLA